MCKLPTPIRVGKKIHFQVYYEYITRIYAHESTIKLGERSFLSSHQYRRLNFILTTIYVIAVSFSFMLKIRQQGLKQCRFTMTTKFQVKFSFRTWVVFPWKLFSSKVNRENIINKVRVYHFDIIFSENCFPNIIKYLASRFNFTLKYYLLTVSEVIQTFALVLKVIL